MLKVSLWKLTSRTKKMLDKGLGGAKLVFGVKDIASIPENEDQNIKSKAQDSISKPKTAKLQISKSKSQMDYLAEISRVTYNIDVNSLRLGDEYLWPYLRNHLWVQLYQLGFAKKAFVNMIPHRLQLGTNTNIKRCVRSKIKDKLGAYEIEELESSNGVDFLFVTVLNASEQIVLNDGSIYYRLTDPLYETASQFGSAEKIEMIKVNSPAIDKCDRYKFPPKFILSPSIIRTGYSYSAEYYPEFFDVLKTNLPSLNIDKKTVLDVIDWEMHTRDYWLDILKKINPKVVFFNGFHFHAPMISAAHELGIKTVDVQHGIQVGWNPLYNDWSELPSVGYQALPDYFLVWGEKERKSIERVFKSSKHRAIVGGFPWLDKQKEHGETLDDIHKEVLKSYKKVFLIVLQNQPKFPDQYRDLIQNSQGDIAWIIRHHPKGQKFEISNLFSNNSQNIFIGDYFDKVALAHLFDVVDVCISEGSTVALEADYFGVKNIIFTKEGFSNYIEEINDGKFYFVKSTPEFYNLIEHLDYLDRSSRVNQFERVDLECVLLSLLN